MHRDRSRTRAGRSTTARRRRARSCPRTNELIWGSDLLRRPAPRSCGSSPWPGLKTGMEARTERIRDDLDDGRPGQGRGRAGARASYQRAARRRQARGGPDHRGGRASADALQGASRSGGCRPSSPRCASGPPPTSRRRRPRPSPTSAREVARWPSVPPRSSCSTTSTAPPRTQLVENYINQVGSSRAELRPLTATATE